MSVAYHSLYAQTSMNCSSRAIMHRTIKVRIRKIMWCLLGSVTIKNFYRSSFSCPLFLLTPKALKSTTNYNILLLNFFYCCLSFYFRLYLFSVVWYLIFMAGAPQKKRQSSFADHGNNQTIMEFLTRCHKFFFL